MPNRPCSRRANGQFRPQFVASSKLAQIRRMCLEYHSKTEFKGKHSQKLPEELIHAVVSLLLVLTDLCDVIIQIFLAEYLLCNNYLLKSKISRQSVKQYGTDSPLKNVIFSTYNWTLGPLHTENWTFILFSVATLFNYVLRHAGVLRFFRYLYRPGNSPRSRHNIYWRNSLESFGKEDQFRLFTFHFRSIGNFFVISWSFSVLPYFR